MYFFAVENVLQAISTGLQCTGKHIGEHTRIGVRECEQITINNFRDTLDAT